MAFELKGVEIKIGTGPYTGRSNSKQSIAWDQPVAAFLSNPPGVISGADLNRKIGIATLIANAKQLQSVANLRKFV